MRGLGDDGHGGADGCRDVGRCANDLAPVFIRASRSSIGSGPFRSRSVLIVVVAAAPP